MRNSPYAWAEEKHFSKWSASLYEKRWKEVCKFNAALAEPAIILWKTFDVRKYVSGVDSVGEFHNKHGEMEQRERKPEA